MRVNGRNRLACKLLMGELGSRITIEAMLGYPVIRDLAWTWTPASIVNAHRFIFDSRDRGAAERLRILSGYDGVWPCKTIFNCTECCPRGIHVTGIIAQVKRAILQGTNEDS